MNDAEKLAVMALVNALMVYRKLRDDPITAKGFDALDRKMEERSKALADATAGMDAAIGGALAICNG
jgi:hypothetical protein